MSNYNRLLACMLRPWALILVPLLIMTSFFYVDIPVASYFFVLQLKNWIPPLLWLTQLGLGIWYLVGLSSAALFFRYVHKNYVWEARCWFLWLCVTLTSTLCVLLKVLLGRARPDLWFGYHKYGFYGFHIKALYWSFPSGHTSTIMGLCFGLATLFPRSGLIYMILGMLVAVSRILLVQHYVSDVAAAAWLALLEIAGLTLILQKKQWLCEAWTPDALFKTQGITQKAQP